VEGLRDLGFVGGAPIPPVIRFGHGFIQGAEHAAAALNLEPGSVQINYTYVGGFAPDPAHVVTASSWFVGGTEVIFAAAGGVGFNVFEAAGQVGGLAIGVDSDQSIHSDTVITSALKAVDVSTYDMLTDILNGSFRGGRTHIYDATLDGVGLPMNTSRFNNFTQAQYDAIFNQIATRAISISDSVEMGVILGMISIVQVNEV